MNSLFDNAVQSIVLGVEDYLTDEPKRALSAVRNLYAGVLLLGKEVLVRHAPKVDRDLLLASRVEPKPDGDGGVTFVKAGDQTVDFETLGRRLNTFGVDVDLRHMKRLNKTRNSVEHRSTEMSAEALREQIAAVFPVVVQLFHYAGEEPGEVLKDVWQEILQVREAYEVEAKACRDTLKAVNWTRAIMSELALCCPICGSSLVAQRDSANSDPYSMVCSCSACLSELDAEEVVETTLGGHFAIEAYVAAIDGGEEPLGICPQCGRETYLWGSEDDGCTMCGAILGRCVLCGEQLSPWSVSADNEDWCSYCHYKMHKDD